MNRKAFLLWGLLAAVPVPAWAQAQPSVQPNRYGSQATPPSNDPAAAYQRQRRAIEAAQRAQKSATDRAADQRYAQAIEDNRRRLEADRQRTERLRAAAPSLAESERLRQEFEQRRQAYEREREALERERARVPPP